VLVLVLASGAVRRLSSAICNDVAMQSIERRDTSRFSRSTIGSVIDARFEYEYEYEHEYWLAPEYEYAYEFKPELRISSAPAILDHEAVAAISRWSAQRHYRSWGRHWL